jgi:hypothetical protein
MAEQTHNRDMSDEPDRQDLEDRVDHLESTISKMLPSRRDALKLGGAALVGGAAMSGAASAQPGDKDGEAGVIGTDNDPVDIEASDIEVDDLVVNQSLQANQTNIRDKVDFLSFTNSDAASFNLNLEINEMLVMSIQGHSSSGGGSSLFMRINNSTSAYETVFTDGTSSTSTQGFEIVDSSGNFGDFAGQLQIMKGPFGRIAVNGPLGSARFTRINKTILSGGIGVQFSDNITIDFQTSGTDPFDLERVALAKALVLL